MSCILHSEMSFWYDLFLLMFKQWYECGYSVSVSCLYLNSFDSNL